MGACRVVIRSLSGVNQLTRYNNSIRDFATQPSKDLTMKNTLRLCAALALMAIASLVSCWRMLTDTVEAVKHVCRAAEKWAIKVVRNGLSLAARNDAGREPSVLLVQARAFYFRLIRRETPLITSQWRMCPSV